MKNKPSRVSGASSFHSTTVGALSAALWLLLTLLSVPAAKGQGTVIFNNRILNAGGVSQTTHIWGPSPTIVISLIGLGSNDSPSGTMPFGAATGMSLIGAGGSGGHFGYATTFAQLLAAPGLNAVGSLVPAAGVTTFRSGSGLGNVAAITATLNGVPLDAPFATVQIVAWDNFSGLYPTWNEAHVGWESGLIAAGVSARFNVSQIGGTQNPPPFLNNMEPLTSFNLWLIPEPATLALAGLGAATLWIFRRRE